MATSDPDGSIMRALQDQVACLKIEMGEFALDLRAKNAVWELTGEYPE